MSRARRFLAEPMVHFLAIGALLFAVHARFTSPPRDRIVVSAGFVDALRDGQLQRTGKPPTAEEEHGMLERWIEEEVLYREAIALHLDRGDVIVRRRLVQKMEFVIQGAVPAGEPSDADLDRFLAEHADRYRDPGATSFRHVFLARDRHGEALDADAGRALSALRSGADPATLGDPFLQGSAFTGRAPRDMEAVFGHGFAEAVSVLPAGSWSGPIRSSYGAHLVLVTEQHAPGAPRLADIRARLKRDWQEERRAEAEKAERDRLRRKYPVEYVP